jgi:hypothetical protein
MLKTGISKKEKPMCSLFLKGGGGVGGVKNSGLADNYGLSLKIILLYLGLCLQEFEPKDTAQMLMMWTYFLTCKVKSFPLI